MSNPDKRLHAYRPDLAEAALRGRIDAARFTEGKEMQVGRAVASLRRQPDETSMQLTEALPGELLRVFDEAEGWAWVKLARDGYVGYVAADFLQPAGAVASHEVATPSTFLYPKADLKTQTASILPMLSRVAVSGSEKDYAALDGGGFIFAKHLAAVGSGSGDFVTVAERFLFTPYYWGGKTVHGLDCSGLVQVSLQATGHDCPRDSDMQEASLGTALAKGEALRRGDLVFWDGHVGIMADREMLLHANGRDMMVMLEPLAEAVTRSAEKGKHVTSIKRL